MPGGPPDCDVLICGLGPVGQLLALLLARLGVSVAGFDRAPRALRPAACRGRSTTRCCASSRRPASTPRSSPQARFRTRSASSPRPGGRSRCSARSRAHSAIRLSSRSTSRRSSGRWSMRSPTHRRAARVGSRASSGSSSCPTGSSPSVRDASGEVRPGQRPLARRRRRRKQRDPRPARDRVRRLDLRPAVARRRHDRGSPARRRSAPALHRRLERPIVCLPMSPGRHRWEWMLHPGEDAEPFLDRDRIAELMEPWLDGESATIERAVVYTFHSRTAQRWREGASCSPATRPT